jgi:ubiquitin-activating enzyme E1
VTGLVVLELYKIIDGKDKIEDYRNGFVNLALPLFAFSEPIASGKIHYKGPNGDVALDKVWSRLEIGDVTLGDAIKHFEDQGLNITMLSSGVSFLYGAFQPPAKIAEKLKMRLSELVESVSKKKIPEHQTEVIFDVVADDVDGNDVEIPYIKVTLTK